MTTPVVKKTFNEKKLHDGRRHYSIVNTRPLVQKKVYLQKPTDLSPVEEIVWDFMSKQLGDSYLAEECDAFCLRLFCKTVEEFYNIRKRIQEEGYFEVDAKGKKQINPLYRVYNDLFSRLLQFIREFGLSPRARGKFAVARTMKIKADNFNEVNKVDKDELFDLMEDYGQPVVQSEAIL